MLGPKICYRFWVFIRPNDCVLVMMNLEGSVIDCLRWQKRSSVILVAVVSCVMLAACDLFDGVFGNEDERILPGERIAVLTKTDDLVAGSPSLNPSPARVVLPRPVVNPSWPQEGGSASRAMGHLAASGPLLKQWQVNIGEGSSSERRLLARPIIGDGRVYVIDAESEISAFDFATGAQLWSIDSGSDLDEEETFGGGLAYDKGRVFATTGFAYAIALDAASGEEIWRAELPGPMRAAPTVNQGLVFVVTIDNQVFALDENTGERLWSHVGVAEIASILGGTSPAVAEGVIILPYSSGEIYALRAASGRELWRENLGAVDRFDALSSIADIAGLPVISDNRVFVISHSGRMVALDVRSGLRLWERNIGGIQTPWVAGDYLFVLTNSGQLLCLKVVDGSTVWGVGLQLFEDMEDREDRIVWHGPLLAGDRLIMVGTHGEILSISPYTGRPLGIAKISGPVALTPSIAQETVVLLDETADLFALR